MEINRK